jgi:transcriptional regulator with XRE-family HTH domain
MEDLIDLVRNPNPVDRHVGLRLRMRRKELGVSQERLAEVIGLTFQQVQKYERAANRISASKLWEVAQALEVPVAYFYEGLGDPAVADDDDAAPSETMHDFLMTGEGMQLASLFPRIPQGPLRRKILELVRVMADQ